MRPRHERPDLRVAPRTLLRLLYLAVACAAVQPGQAATARQRCRFPDGELRVVVQELAASYGGSISECVTVPDIEPAASNQPADPVVIELAVHEAGQSYREAVPRARQPSSDLDGVPTYRDIAASFGEGYPVPTEPVREIHLAGAVTVVEAPASRTAWFPSLTRGRNDAKEAPLEYQALIARSARNHGVDPHIIEAVMYVESHFEARAQSNKGAVGLMQLMPQTAQHFGVSSSARLFDPATNIECGTRYLGELTSYFEGRLDLAIAAYNAGPGAVVKYGWRIPPFAETQAYVQRVLQRVNSLR